MLCSEAKALQWSPFRSKNKVLFHSKDAGNFQKGKKWDKMFSLWIPKSHFLKSAFAFAETSGTIDIDDIGPNSK